MGATALGLAAVVGGGPGTPVALGAGSPDYPAADSGYTSYAELTAEIHQLADAHPDLVAVRSIGRSAQGRPIWIVKISDNVADPVEPGEPEVLFDALHHAREHLTVEMAMSIIHLLVDHHGDPDALGRRVTAIVDGTVTWVVPMLNPDGWAYDVGAPASRRRYGPDGSHFYAGWRKNRQAIPGSRQVGVDLNRSWGYDWGCCRGSSGSPASETYRGPRPWSAPEVRALRDFVKSRVIGGQQRITEHVTWHTTGQQILWPYGHTYADVPRDMTALDHRTFVALGRAMAALNGYRAMQSSDLYPTDGDEIDWMYGTQRIFSFTFEMYPAAGSSGSTDRFYPPDSLIDRETSRNRGAVLYLLEHAGCVYGAIGRAAAYCGPLYDDFETGRGWTRDPAGTDTATAGGWGRGRPARSSHQRRRAWSGQSLLVTGRGRNVDVDGGTTTARSPLVTIPADAAAHLHLRAWVGLDARAGAGDGLTIRLVDESGAVIGDPLLVVAGDGTDHPPTWRSVSVALPPASAGQRVAVQLEATDDPSDGDATVETGVDDVRITLD
ncbi:MAG: M14 family metallopeptidase [Chloroflexota bacterium]